MWANISYASAQPASAVGLVPLGCYADLTENGNAACLGNSWFVTETSRKARQDRLQHYDSNRGGSLPVIEAP